MDSFEKMFCPFVRKYLLSGRRLSGLGTDQMLGQYPKYSSNTLFIAVFISLQIFRSFSKN